MPHEEINERIDVIAVFTQQGIRPWWIKWRDRRYKVKVNSNWSQRDGHYKTHYFSVSIGTSDCYKIRYDTEKESWQLDSIYLEG